MSRGGAAGSPLRRGKFICTLLPVISRGRGIAGGATGHGVFHCGQKKQESGKALSSPSHHLLSSSALPHVHFCHCIMKYCADLVL